MSNVQSGCFAFIPGKNETIRLNKSMLPNTRWWCAIVRKVCRTMGSLMRNQETNAKNLEPHRATDELGHPTSNSGANVHVQKGKFTAGHENALRPCN